MELLWSEFDALYHFVTQKQNLVGFEDPVPPKLCSSCELEDRVPMLPKPREAPHF
jgi:hypothetical protein